MHYLRVNGGNDSRVRRWIDGMGKWEYKISCVAGFIPSAYTERLHDQESRTTCHVCGVFLAPSSPLKSELEAGLDDVALLCSGDAALNVQNLKFRKLCLLSCASSMNTDEIIKGDIMEFPWFRKRQYAELMCCVGLWCQIRQRLCFQNIRL